LLEKEAIDAVSRILTPECFYVDAHMRIYAAILEMSKKSLGIDILTVVQELKFREELDIVGGPFFVTKLTNSVVSSAYIEQHANIIFEKYLLREQIRIGSQIVTDAYEDSADAFECLDKANEKLGILSLSNVRGEGQSIEAIMVKTIQRIEYLRSQKDDITGVPSGLPDIDRVTYGWQSTDLIILAARPSVGKTAIALNFARNAALDQYKPTPVLVFSLEMSSNQLSNRILAAETEIWLDKISRGKLDDDDMRRIYITITIDDTPALNIYELRAKARRWRKKNVGRFANKGLILIDYLQLMSGVGDNKSQNREQEVSSISRNLKALAKELEVPIIALSQLSREVEKRAGNIPQLSDLRESGAIEQDADMVCFIYRADYGLLENEIPPAIKGVTNLKIAKHRNGSLEEIPLRAELSIQKFFTLDQYEAYQQKFKIGSGSYIPFKMIKPTGTDNDDPF
jgi:replicative DNA helicase